MSLTKAERLDIVAEHFPHRPTKELAIMCECSVRYVQQLARLLGLRKTTKARANAPYVRFERWFV